MATSINTRLFLIAILFFVFTGIAYAIEPENLEAEPVSQTEIRLSWENSNKKSSYYTIERSVGNDNNFVEVAIISSNTTNYSDKSLTANTVYYYRIKAVLNRIFGTTTAYSNIAQTTTLPNPPAAPSELKTTVKSQTEVDLTWKDNADTEEGFYLERSEKNNNSFEEIQKLSPNTVSYSDKNLKSNTTYFYRIRSYSIGGNSEYASAASATTYQYQPTLNPIPDPESVLENADTQQITLTGISDGGDGGQKITVSATSSNKDLMPDPQIVYSSPENTAVLRFRTNRNQYGTSTITVTVKDDGPSDGPVSNSVTQSFKITVLELNDPPTLNAIANPAAIFENSDTQTIQLTGISAGPEEDQNLTVTAISDNPELIPNPSVTYSSPQATGSLSFKPVANKTGKATITVTVKDDGPGTSPHQNTFTRSFEVTVLWVNKAPTLDAITDPAPIQHTSGEQTIALTGISAGPNDDQKLSVTATVDKPELLQNLVVDYTSPQSTASIRYTPVVDKLGTAVITVTVKDDGPGTAPHVNTFSRSFNVRITDIPLVASTVFPEYFTASSNEAIGITVHENITVDKVELHYRPVNENDWKVADIPANGTNYHIPTPDAFFGPVGLEYFFVVHANGVLTEETNIGKTYLKYGGNGLAIPDLTFGDTEAHYQIVSVPLQLTQNSVPMVFEDDLGKYDPTQWRLFHYLDSAVEYPGKFNNIEPGKGYWLIVRREKAVDTGEGTTYKVDRSTPFEIELKKGWNQIGNPYNMDIRWSDVIQSNNNELGPLHVFENGALIERDLLKKFRGGFVFAENNTKISIPVVMPTSGSNGRIAERNSNPNDAEGWDVQLEITSSGKTQAKGGIGMRTDALQGKDHYDQVAVPSFGFIKQAKFNFDHPEYFYPHFSKDIVPVTENHIWEFSVESNIQGELLELNWSSPDLDEELEMTLIDLSKNTVIDMNNEKKYSFSSGQNTNFKIIYGSKTFSKENTKPEYVSFNKPYPNPFKDQITFPFAVSEAESDIYIQLNIYDITGRVVATPINSRYDPGFHEGKWDGNNFSGRKMTPGVYIYKMTISKDNALTEHKGRLILE